MNVQTITPQEFEGLRRRGQTVDQIEVRPLVEDRGVHAGPVRSPPLGRLDAGTAAGASAGSPVVLGTAPAASGHPSFLGLASSVGAGVRAGHGRPRDGDDPGPDAMRP